MTAWRERGRCPGCGAQLVGDYPPVTCRTCGRDLTADRLCVSCGRYSCDAHSMAPADALDEAVRIASPGLRMHARAELERLRGRVSSLEAQLVAHEAARLGPLGAT